MNRFLFYIIAIVFSFNGYSQDDQKLYDHRLNEDKWEDLRDGIRYEGREEGPGREWTYENREEYQKAAEDKGGSGNGNGGGNGNGSGSGSGSGDGANNLERDHDNSSSSPPPQVNTNFSGLGVFGYVLLALFLVGLVFLIYYMYLNSESDGTKVNREIDLDELNPTEIPLTELERLLQEALAKGDYRGAIRIYFIFIVRDLSNKGWIRWQKEKTNFHYLREMSGKAEFDDFNRSVSFFEIIWYGKRDVDLQKFEEIKPNFTRFLDKLGVK